MSSWMNVNAASSPLSLGIKILRQVIKENPSENGWTKAELLKLAHKIPPPPDFKPFTVRPSLPPLGHPPPHPEHPIRSLGFVRDVMRALEDANEVQIFRTQREMTHIPKKQKGKHQQAETPTGPVLVDVFAWRLSTSPPNPNPRRIYVEGKKTKIKPVVGREVGVGLDTSHLSKRRQAARVGKVSREVLKMKVNWEKENGMAWLQRGKVAKFKA